MGQPAKQHPGGILLRQNLFLHRNPQMAVDLLDLDQNGLGPILLQHRHDGQVDRNRMR